MQPPQSLSTLTPLQRQNLHRSIRRGLRTLEKPEPLRLSEWAARNFYLSPESSYVEGRWEAYPYQIGIMDMISHDDVEEVTLLKSARCGYTKMILAAIGYFAEHRRRNQAIWQPVDDDADEFCKTELETMLRDVPAVRNVFPHYDKKSKYNTLQMKAFLACMLHIRGGKAAKNYRRLSIDVGFADELDGFDADIEDEGAPDALIKKRMEGATFPKLICGSTPTLEESSLISKRIKSADEVFRFHVPCPHCGESQPLLWGGKDEAYGLKWVNENPETAAYLCVKCASLFNQAEYLKIWDRGHWRSESGMWLDENALFRDANGSVVQAPKHCGIIIWTIYSPQKTWQGIVSDWLKAKNDPSQRKTFVNTTRGEPYKEDVQYTDPKLLLHRRENYGYDSLPSGILWLTAGVDVQGNRLECEVIGWRQDGRDSPPESWGVEYRVFAGDPARQQVWSDLDEFLKQTWRTEDGRTMRVGAGCVDTGGHHTGQAYSFCEARKGRHIYATKGRDGAGTLWPIRSSKSIKYKSQVWILRVDSGKGSWYGWLNNTEPGPGYCHFPTAYPEEFFHGLTAEVVKTKYRNGRAVRFYFLPAGKRNEPLDCRVLALAALHARPPNWEQIRPIIDASTEKAPKAPLRKPESGGWLRRNEGQPWLRR